MLMLTKRDAFWAAAHLSTLNEEYFYIAAPNFLGYEGADYGVNKHAKNTWGYPTRFIEGVSHCYLVHLCFDRPIVDQSQSWSS